MRQLTLAIVAPLCALPMLDGSQIVRGQQLSGTCRLLYERSRVVTTTTATDDLTWTYVDLYYDDILFVKNRIRFWSSLQWKDYSFRNNDEHLPIYGFNLRSNTYAFDFRYSPYKRASLTPGAAERFDLYNRDFRFTGRIAYASWPSVNLLYNRLRTYDREAVRRYDASRENVIVGSAYNHEMLSISGSYNRLSQRDFIATGNGHVATAYTGTAALQKAFAGVGYVSGSYNYYDTERTGSSIATQTSRTHTVSSLLTLSPSRSVVGNASYSGRFTDLDIGGEGTHSKNQVLSAKAAFSPVSFLEIEAIKGYQSSEQEDSTDLVEYASFGASFTRFIRHGVDSRFAVERTVFQKSLRPYASGDSAAIRQRDTGYTFDTFHASVNAAPIPFVRAYLDLTLSHDHRPVAPERRYQLVRSVDMRLRVSRKVEGRLSVSVPYYGKRLRFGGSVSENYNVGFSYIPRSNLNITGSYILSNHHSAGTSTLRSSLTGYASYAFRRAISLHLSVNQRADKTKPGASGDDLVAETSDRPRAFNAQILINPSRKTTLSIAYTHTRTEGTQRPRAAAETIQSVFTLQI